MSTTMPVKDLPDNPSITHLKNQAKKLKSDFSKGDVEARARVEAFHPDPSAITDMTLRDAQLVIAREYGFDGWHQLNTVVGELMVDRRDLHRWFGTQLNNGMWDAIADGSVGPTSPMSDREDALYSAFASAYHWRMVGTEANKARGEHLISRMATAVGEPELALRHATRCLEITAQSPSEMSDWDAAFGYEAFARANASLGRMDTARDALAKAKELTSQVAEEEDRRILSQELQRGPWFGLSV